MIKITSATFNMGASDSKAGYPIDNEAPQVQIKLKSYSLDETTVTNSEFKQFIEETGYVTDAERIGWSFVFHYFLDSQTKHRSKQVPGLPLWYMVKLATWKNPEGQISVFPERALHPVVQVSHNDAVEYCKWAGKRLPTEAEWEYAAKGGTNFEKYPWGDSEIGVSNCNIWQGNFPYENSELDGFSNTAPVRSFPANGYGVYEVIGNVWEWCANPAKIPLENFNAMTSEEFWESCLVPSDNDYATRGGSFLCHQSYCKRYRIAARNGNSATSAANNIGFRCVK